MISRWGGDRANCADLGFATDGCLTFFALRSTIEAQRGDAPAREVKAW